MIVRLRYIQKFRDRHGRLRVYLRRRGCKPVPLPDQDSAEFLAAYQAALLASEPVKPTSRVPQGSLEDLCRGYVAGPHFRQLGTSTQAVYRRIIADLCRKHGTKPVRLLEPRQARRIVESKVDTPAAANHVLRTLRALMKHAIKLGWIDADPTRDVERLKEVGEGAETWTEEEIAAFEARWPIGSRPRLALALLLYTGQRRSDVVRMGHQHVRDGAIEVRQVKTKARLLIPLHAELAQMLVNERDRLTFLVTATGKPFTPNGFYMRFKGWVKDAGLPVGHSPHGLRKAAARRLAEGGCTAHQIASITGHKTLAEVQRYTRAADQVRMAQQAAQHLGRPQTGNGSVKPERPKSVKPATSR